MEYAVRYTSTFLTIQTVHPDISLPVFPLSQNDEADLYNSHVYKFDYNTSNLTLVNWERQNIALQEVKRHFVGESGFPGYGSARQYGIDTYTRGVQIIRVALNYLECRCLRSKLLESDRSIL